MATNLSLLKSSARFDHGPWVDVLDITELPRITELIIGRQSLAVPGWEHIDPQGHYHAFVRVQGSNGGDTWDTPTLVQLDVMEPCNGECGLSSCEGNPVPRWYCRICNAEVFPEWRTEEVSIEANMDTQTMYDLRLRGWPFSSSRISISGPAVQATVEIHDEEDDTTMFGICTFLPEMKMDTEGTLELVVRNVALWEKY